MSRDVVLSEDASFTAELYGNGKTYKKESYSCATSVLSCGYRWRWSEQRYSPENALYLGLSVTSKEGKVSVGLGFDVGLGCIVDSSISALFDDEDFKEKLGKIEDDAELQRAFKALADTFQRARDRLINALPPSNFVGVKDGEEKSR